MSVVGDDELRTLRLRAYGPRPDIADDPAALARLSELEARERGRTVEPAIAETTEAATAVEPPPSLEATPESDATDTGGARRARRLTADPAPESASADDAPPSRPRRRLVIRIAWIASLVIVAALSAGITYAVVAITPVATSSGAPQVATLGSTTAMEVPAGWMGAGPSSEVYEFYGLTLFRSALAYDSRVGSAGSDCLTLVRTDLVPDPDEFSESSGTYSFNGEVNSGCRLGAFPAAVGFAVNTNAPRELSQRFPEGSSLQFVLDGDNIGVFLDSE